MFSPSRICSFATLSTHCLRNAMPHPIAVRRCSKRNSAVEHRFQNVLDTNQESCIVRVCNRDRDAVAHRQQPRCTSLRVLPSSSQHHRSSRLYSAEHAGSTPAAPSSRISCHHRVSYFVRCALRNHNRRERSASADPRRVAFGLTVSPLPPSGDGKRATIASAATSVAMATSNPSADSSARTSAAARRLSASNRRQRRRAVTVALRPESRPRPSQDAERSTGLPRHDRGGPSALPLLGRWSPTPRWTRQAHRLGVRRARCSLVLST